MQKWTISEIIEHARKYSPFYRDLYENLDSFELSNLPIIDQAEFWKAQVVTEKSPDGIVYKSGGSTGAPKYSYFTHEEWKSFCEAFGWGMSEGILENGDRVGNLFYVGDLYASFLFIKDSLQGIPTSKKKFAQFPIAGQTDHLQILKTLEEFDINVIVGVPSAILTMLEKYSQNKDSFKKLKLEKILFGGEALYDDQEKALREIFPKLKISSIGCASVDGGLIGYSSLDCTHGEHRVFDSANIIEIVDSDTGEVITEKNRVGKVL
ncbi:MAG: AMP-binding protein, partial [Bdellovibrionales bacterium]|nr:AMP-binding protein [Bdellovibrionales bacterium]